VANKECKWSKLLGRKVKFHKFSERETGGMLEKRGKAREEKNPSGGATLFQQNLANNRKNCHVIEGPSQSSFSTLEASQFQKIFKPYCVTTLLCGVFPGVIGVIFIRIILEKFFFRCMFHRRQYFYTELRFKIKRILNKLLTFTFKFKMLRTNLLS